MGELLQVATVRGSFCAKWIIFRERKKEACGDWRERERERGET